MRAAAVVVVVVVVSGCSSPSSSSDDANTLDPENFAYHALTLGTFSGDGRIGPLGFGGALSAASGDQTFFIGEADNRYVLLSLRSPSEPVFAKGLTASTAIRPSSIVPDGSGGVFVAINLPVAVVGGNPQPAVTRWDRSGNLLWSKRYERTGSYWAGFSNQTGFSHDTVNPDVMLSTPVDGKVVMLAGNSVVVIDDAGTPVWTYYIAASYAFQQVVATPTSIRVFGRNYRDMVEVTLDWSGTLVSFRRSTNAFPQNSDARLFRPHLRSDGTLWLSYELLAFTNATTGGFALAADGTRVDGWRYDFLAFYSSISTVELDHSFVLSDNLLAIGVSYGSSTGFTLAHVVMPMSSSGAPDITRFSTSREPWVVATDGSVQGFENLHVGGGTVGAMCSRDFIQLEKLDRVPDTTLFPSFLAVTPPTATAFTATSADFAITVEDMPPTSMLSTRTMTAGCR